MNAKPLPPDRRTRPSAGFGDHIATALALLAVDRHTDAPALIEQHLARIEGREPELGLKFSGESNANPHHP